MEKEKIQKVDRQNILNNPFAIKKIEEEIKEIPHFIMDGKIYFLKENIVKFFQIDERTLERTTEENKEELLQNGYKVLTGKSLNKAKVLFGSDKNVATKITRLAVFDFRAFLNIAMLLKTSIVAKDFRSKILDIAIDSIRQKTGGKTKYINQNDKTFLPSYTGNKEVRSKFTDALKNYVSGDNYKYPYFTNKIYQNIFGENAKEYRNLLKLSQRENIRNTFYREILDVISGYEEGISEALQLAFKKKGSKLLQKEAENIFNECFESPFLRRPRETARHLMVSRDKVFREILHEALTPYLETLSEEEYKLFLENESQEIGKKTNQFLKIIDKNKDIFDRLKNR